MFAGRVSGSIARGLALGVVALGAGAAACSGEADGPVAPDAPPLDGPRAIDAPAATVIEVSPCPTMADAIVTTRDDSYNYSPVMTTISVGEVVRFGTSLTHDVAPLPPMTDPGLVVPTNSVRCLRFTAAGTFRFKCTPHGFTGTITVQ